MERRSGTFTVEAHHSSMGTAHSYHREGESEEDGSYFDILDTLCPDIGEGAELRVTVDIVRPGCRGINPYQWRAPKSKIHPGWDQKGSTIVHQKGYAANMDRALCDPRIELGYAVGGGVNPHLRQCSRCRLRAMREFNL